MKSMLKKLNEVNDNQLRTAGIFFTLIGFMIVWYFKKLIMKFKIINIYLVIFFLLFASKANSKDVPGSFADLAEKLMSVVNIATSQTVTTNVNPFPFDFPPGSPFEDMFKDFKFQKKENKCSRIRIYN